LITFKVVRWKNLLSTGNIFTEVNLTDSPSTLIVGENGAGKSTFIEAISYALYGKPFRRINKPQLVNTINQKNMLVELEFCIGNKEFIVRRGMKPGIFEIVQDGILVNQDAAMRDYQEYLEKNILKLNHKSFTQIITLGSRSYVPFMQLPTGQRREIIEDLLDLQIFSVMNTILKQKVSDNKEAIRDVKYNADLCQEKIRLQKDYMNNVKINNDKQIGAHKIRITELTTIIADLETSITDINADINMLANDIADQSSITAKIKELETLKSAFNDKISKIRKEITFYDQNDNCPTCKQGIEHSFKCDTVDKKNSQLTESQVALDEIDIKYTELGTRLSEITIINSQITALNQKIFECNTQIKSNQDFIKKLEAEVVRLSLEHKENTDDQEKLNLLKAELKLYVENHEALINKKSIIDVVAVLLKDGGIKAKIIKQYIPVMNKLINKYLASMELTVSFELDENFNETVRSRHRDEFSYDSFSEGEKARIDLAILFAWRAISKLRNGNSSNLLILDETFDGSLDSTGTEELLKIISGITADSNVFVISHKPDQMVDKFSNVIRFEKVKNFSRIKDAA
jgi:DNA repair exonuclease SbcCD ATPase subunit